MKTTIFRSNAARALAFMLVLSLLTLTACQIKGKEGVVVEINDKTWVAELATTPAEWEQGLMFRDELAPNRGMLFVFPDDAPRSFWMKNTKIPLDMIFIDSRLRVVAITTNATPCVTENCTLYKSERPAKFVLEINAGEAKDKNVKVGQQVKSTLKN